MREIRLYGSEGGGAVRSPYPYQRAPLYFWRRSNNCFSVSRSTPSFSLSE